MSKHEKESGFDCLFERQDMKLVNVKFCRGSNDLITPKEFRAQLKSAAIQARTGYGSVANPPHSGRQPVNIRDLVARL